MSFKHHLSTSIQSVLLCAATGLGMSMPAHAQTPARTTVSKAELEEIKVAAESKYHAALDKCKLLSGNANDVCKATAKLDRTSSVAVAEARHAGTPKAAYVARKDMADARYALAKEVCDDKAGNDKDVCRQEAKSAFTSEKANAEVKLKTREAIEEATQDKVDARYAVAKEKCDALAGAAKDACMEKVKADFAK